VSTVVLRLLTVRRALGTVLLIALVVLVGCAPPAAAPTPAAPPTPTAVHAEAIATFESGPIPTQFAVAAATSIAASPVQITAVDVDSANPENTGITLHNSGTRPVDLSNWLLLINSYRARFPTTNYMTLAPNSDKIVHLSSSSTPVVGDNIYLGVSSVSAGMGLFTSGNQVLLLDNENKVASQYQVP
jgi:hypothetical protein